jgi:hypothetical protein
MATTIQESFRQFRSNLEITGLQKETVSSRQQAVRDAVSENMDVSDKSQLHSNL